MYSFWQKILDIVFTEYGITLPNIDSCLSYPPKPDLWDFAFSCFIIAKEIKANPNEIATRLSTLFDNDKNTFASASSMGWYVNFHLNNNIFMQDLYKISLEDKPNNNETIIVDYIWANVWKPLHIWHLCTPSLWQAIINTYKYLGYNVVSDSHFGDWWGIFGKLIYAWKNLFNVDNFPQFEKDFSLLSIYLSNIEEYKKKVNELKYEKLNKDWLVFILWLYTNFHIRMVVWETIELLDKIKIEREEWARKEFQYLSWVWINLTNPEELAHHKENAELWKKFTAISIKEVSKQLEEELNIKPQYNIWESFYEWLNLPRPNVEDYPDLKYNMKDIVAELLEKWVATKNEDWSVGVVFPEEAKMPSCVLQKKDGTWLYLTSDLAAIKYRLTNWWNPNKIVYFVDVRQQLHLKQAFWIAKKAWPEAENIELTHAHNGFIKLKEGAMSTRKWTVIFLKDLIEEWYSRTAQILESKWRNWEPTNPNVKAITIGAIKYSYLSQDREKDIVFDWDKALSFEWNSGPYIQYAYVRASKIINHAQFADRHPELVSGSMDTEINSVWRMIEVQLSQYDKSLIKKLNEFEWKVQETANKYKPHIIAQYCYELASEFNSFYVNTPRILEEQDENLRNIRLTIIYKIKEVLHKWFELLAIDMPDEM